MKRTLSITLIAMLLFLSNIPPTALAQTNDVSTSCVITKVGNPKDPEPQLPSECESSNNGNLPGGGPNNDIAKLASDLVPAAQQCNSGVIVSELINPDPLSNYQCMGNKIPSSANHVLDAFNEIGKSVHVFNGYYQCVGFAETVDSGINSSANDPLDQVSISFAYQFQYNIPPGYSFIDKSSGSPQEGDFAIWDEHQLGSGGAGHIAVVIQVLDKNDFKVAQANWSAHGKVDTMFVRTSNYTGDYLAGFLHKK